MNTKTQVADIVKKSRYVTLHNCFWSITKDTNSALLLDRLCYWASKSKRKGFYKFLSPAQNHKRYKVGDSLSEELHLSYKAISSALKKLGAFKMGNKQREQLVNTGLGEQEAEQVYRDERDKALVKWTTDGGRLSHFILNHDALLDLLNGKKMVVKLPSKTDGYMPEGQQARKSYMPQGQPGSAPSSQNGTYLITAPTACINDIETTKIKETKNTVNFDNDSPEPDIDSSVKNKDPSVTTNKRVDLNDHHNSMKPESPLPESDGVGSGVPPESTVDAEVSEWLFTTVDEYEGELIGLNRRLSQRAIDSIRLNLLDIPDDERGPYFDYNLVVAVRCLLYEGKGSFKDYEGYAAATWKNVKMVYPRKDQLNTYRKVFMDYLASGQIHCDIDSVIGSQLDDAKEEGLGLFSVNPLYVIGLRKYIEDSCFLDVSDRYDSANSGFVSGHEYPHPTTDEQREDVERYNYDASYIKAVIRGEGGGQ